MYSFEQMLIVSVANVGMCVIILFMSRRYRRSMKAAEDCIITLSKTLTDQINKNAKQSGELIELYNLRYKTSSEEYQRLAGMITWTPENKG